VPHSPLGARARRIQLNRTTGCALCLALAGLFSLPALAQQPSPKSPAAQPVQAGPDSIAKAREALHKAETDHPGNTPELALALSDLVSKQVDAGTVDVETLSLVNRELQIQEALAGPRSKAYIGLLVMQADVLTGIDRSPEARVVSEQALEIAQKEFPDTTDAANAASALGRICSKMGDFPCAVRAHGISVDLTRKLAGPNSAELLAALNNLGAMKGRMGDSAGAVVAQEEALAIAYRLDPTDNHFGVIENNLGLNYLKLQNFPKATEHLTRAVDMLTRLYGPESPRLMQINRNLAALYTRTGQFPLAWKAYEFSEKNKYEQTDMQASNHALFAQSLAQGGAPQRAIDEGLASARISRDFFVLQARTLPERQALAYDATRPHGLDTAISVVLKHPEIPTADIYQEVVRSRALVADEMAHRQKNLNANDDPEIARLLKELNHARTDLLAAEHDSSHTAKHADMVDAANQKMEAIERTLAEHSAALRADERVYQATTNDIRHFLPPHAVLISYVLIRRGAVDTVDPANADTPAYVAFVLHPEAGPIRVFNLGDAAPLDELVRKARAAADAEAHSGGLGSTRNERNYREAALALRQRIWDPLKPEIGDVRMALVVADGNLNLIPFAGLPDGAGYMVEHEPVVHMLSSERDLVPAAPGTKKLGLLAIGSPSFELAENKLPPSPLRGAEPTCEEYSKLQFNSLPGTAVEVSDIASTWRKWNGAEPSHLVTGDDATLARFLADAGQNRVLHVATHAFLLDKSCGSGNPLLHSGLVFAGGSHGGTQSVLTAQQIASLDLSGADWAVLSACNTGNGELRDGEGVLGLERAFRVAGARSVIMTLWPVDDNVARQFMHGLYAQRLGRHASTADAVWNSARALLLERRAAGKSTHPWYWAGFVGAGGWE